MDLTASFTEMDLLSGVESALETDPLSGVESAEWCAPVLGTDPLGGVHPLGRYLIFKS